MQRNWHPFASVFVVFAQLCALTLSAVPGSAAQADAKPLSSSAFGFSPTGSQAIECVDCTLDFAQMTDNSLASDITVMPHALDHDWSPMDDREYAPSSGETAWQIETVDSAGDVGSWSSLALDAANRPHISYLDNTNRDLKYARFDGEAWQIETVDSSEGAGYSTSLALDATGRPHISYFDWANYNLKYAHYDGAVWQIETVDSGGDVGWYTSLALDAAGRPYISYYDLYNGDLKYARFDGAAWQIETVDSSSSESVGLYTSLALDAAGQPHISYFDFTNGDLKHAYHDDAAWRIETVDTVGDVGGENSLALDAAGRPHIAYHDRTNHDLRYARFDGEAWQIETVDSAGNVGSQASLALDAADRPHISYFDYTNYNLKYARFDGEAWQIETVDSNGDVGVFTSLALDSADRPHISYGDDTSDDLKYARGLGPAEPRTWTLMYYQAGDSTTEDGEDFGVAMLSQTAHLQDGSNNTNLNVVVFRDTLSAGAVYESYVDGAPVENTSKGELNTGWPETLSDFVFWAKSNYPASHYALVMFGHGHGLTGSMQDLTNDPQSEGDFLDPRDFRTALLESGPVDVVYMESCLMANLEYAYQARGQTLYYVASEAQVVGPASHTYLSDISSVTSARDLAEKMAQAYEEEFEKPDALERTISVGDMSKIELVVQRTRELAAETRSHCCFDPLAGDIWNIISGDDVQRFPDNEENVLADLYHFAQLVDGLGDTDLSTAANNLMAAIDDDYIVKNDDWAGNDKWDFSNAHGLSIILPTEPLCYYTAEWFDFSGGVYWALCPLASPSQGDVLLAEENEWGQMLSDMIAEFNPDAEPQYEPPPLVPVDVLPLERLFLPLILRVSSQ